MNSLNKSKYIKLGSVIFLIIGLLLISESNSHARFLKKIVVEPLLNPKDWQKSFMPGTAFTLMLENSLAKSGQFQIIRSPKDSAKKILSNIFKTKDIVEGENQEVIREENQGPNDKEIQENKKGARIEGDSFSEQTSSLKVPSSQYQVRGQFLIFDPDTNPIKGSQTRNQVLRYKEKAKVKVVVELINLRTERSLAKKSFTFISNDGRTAFNSDLTTLDYETLEFKLSSIGKAFWKLNNSVEAFIVRILNDVPLEGDLISVDNKILFNKEVEDINYRTFNNDTIPITLSYFYIALWFPKFVKSDPDFHHTLLEVDTFEYIYNGNPYLRLLK